jgi:anti-sigma factor RsiW
MSCRRVTPVLEAFVDGELAADMVMEVEQHLVDCVTCAERVRVGRALHISLGRAVRSAAPVTAAFRDRISLALAAEAEREYQAELADGRGSPVFPLSWRSGLLVSAAAAATLVWAGSVNTPQARAAHTKDGYREAEASSVEGLLEALVDHHVHAPSPEVTEPALLRQFESEVGVPVRAPSLRDYGGLWEGGSVVPVNNQHAASLRYRMGGHRITLYVYDSSRLPIETKLLPRVVRNEPVYVGHRRGVSIAATEKRGVGYALATDFNDDESAELVASLR